jgi:5-methylcytosine-specific restriction endonuclease McrA
MVGKRKFSEVCAMEVDWDASWKSKPAPKKRKTYIPKVWDTHIGKHIGSTLCTVCNNNEITQLDFHCGHIIAEAEGGETSVNNLMPICASCNLSMGRKNMHVFKNTYFK